MAYDNKYGQIDIPGIPEDEPVFILRAKDMLAVDTIMDYERRATHAYILGGHQPTAFIAGLERCIERFMQWAEKHSDKMKMPD